MFKSFKNFDPINEATEKLKVRSANPKNPNGEAAFLIKFIGPSFDKPTIEAFLKNNPDTKTMIDKINQFGNQYFIAFTTKKDGEARVFSRNSTWAVFVELINASKDGKIVYQGFNAPPYNNFVDYKDLDKLLATGIAPTDPIVQVTKSLSTSASQTSGSTPTVSTETAAPAETSTPPVTAATEAKPTDPNKLTDDEDIRKQYDIFYSLNVNSRGEEMVKLQKTIEIIARAQNNETAMKLMGQSIKPDGTGRYDGIYGPKTSEAYQLILDPEGGRLSALLPLMLKNHITPQRLDEMTPSQLASKKAFNSKIQVNTAKNISTRPGTNPSSVSKPAGSSPVATKTPVAQPVQQGKANDEGLTYVDTRIGKIYYA